MKGYAPIFFGFFLFSAVVVFYVFLNQTKQIDLSTAAEKRTNCVTFAQNSAKSALDKYIDQYYKNEGAAIIPSEDIVNVENYIKESMAAYDASIADVNSITVGNCTVTTGSYSQQPHSSASGENRLVQSSTPTVTFRISGVIERVVTTPGDMERIPFSDDIKVEYNNVSRDDAYKETTKIMTQPYNNIY